MFVIIGVFFREAKGWFGLRGFWGIWGIEEVGGFLVACLGGWWLDR